MSGLDFREHLAGHVRLAVLRVLEEAPGYQANSAILLSAIEMLGLRTTRDGLETELAWLAEQGLVALERLLAERLTVATLTGRGLDVALGRALVPGVARPAPRG
jgi:hypothetical protein